MNSLILLGLLTGGSVLAASPGDLTAWQWEQRIQVPQTGLVRLELPAATLDASQPSLADLRLLSPAGVEIPYLIQSPTVQAPRQREVGGFNVQLIEAAPNIEAATVIEFDTETEEPLAAVTLRSPAPEFIKSVTIQGTSDGENWQPIATREVIFRQPTGSDRLRLPLPSKAWRKLRLTLSDARSRPIPVTSAGLTLAAAEPETIAHAVTLVRTVRVSRNTTRLVLDLGAANLHLGSLDLTITDPVFSRSVSLAGLTNAADGTPLRHPLGHGNLYRVQGEAGDRTEQLGVPVNQRVAFRGLEITIDNGDSPALTVTAASARLYPTILLFQATEAGGWSLLTGNPQAKTPSYDLQRLATTLTAATSQHLTPGALHAHAGFAPATPLPGIEPAGATLDVSPWSRRCAVKIPGPGVIRIELKPGIIAASKEDLSDLRLIQGGRQLPYLFDPKTGQRTIDCSSSPLPADPKRPGVSRWKIEQPYAGLRAATLFASSPTPMFSRTFSLRSGEPDPLTHQPQVFHGQDSWTKTVDQPTGLALMVGGSRLPTSLVLETEDGDNPPIAIDRVQVHYATVSIAAKIISNEPLFLYYGNPEANRPNYDLRLVRAEMLAADRVSAPLGEEEILKPEPPSPWTTSPGSPWLWAALALVVGGLLVIVARLLPKGSGVVAV